MGGKLKSIVTFLGVIYAIAVVYFTFHFHSTQYHPWAYCVGEALVWPAHVWPALGRLIGEIVGGIILIIFLIFLFLR